MYEFAPVCDRGSLSPSDPPPCDAQCLAFYSILSLSHPHVHMEPPYWCLESVYFQVRMCSALLPRGGPGGYANDDATRSPCVYGDVPTGGNTFMHTVPLTRRRAVAHGKEKVADLSRWEQR